MAKNTKHSITKKHMPNNKKPLLSVETEISLNQKVGLIVGMVCAFLVGIVWTAVLLTPILPTAPKTVSPEQAWNDFKANYGQNWQIEWKEANKTPTRLIGGTINVSKINSSITTVNKDNIDSIARQFLRNNQTLFKVNDADLKISQIYDDPSVGEEASQRIVTIHYQQNYQKLLVSKSHLGITFKNNNLIIYDANYFPNLALSSATPTITAEEAFENTKFTEINGLYPKSQSPYLNQSFAPTIKKESDKTGVSVKIPKINPDDLKLEKSSLVIYPEESESKVNFYLAYKLELGLIKEPYLSHPTYYINALDGNSLERYENIRFANLDGTVTGLEYPYYPPCELGQDPAHCTQAGSQISPFQNDEVRVGVNSVNTNASGYYLFSGLSGTVSLTSGLNGPYVDVNNLSQADASHAVNITVPATHNWNWETQGDSSYKKEESNVFYHVNKIHDYFTQGSPFDITGMNFIMPAFVQEIYNPCPGNAWYDNNGVDFGIHFCQASCPYEATSLGSDVIYHEYTHAVTDNIYSGFYFPYIGETGAMDEGYADFYAANILNRSTIGDGIWREPIRDLNNTLRYPDDWLGEVHYDSLMFSGSLWDLRVSFGNNTDDMVISTEKTHPDSFREFLENLIALYPQWIDGICDKFYSKHGIYSNLCVHHTIISPIAYIGNPTDRLEISKNPASLDIIGTAAKSSAEIIFRYFTVEYASVNSPDTWLTNGVTLTHGGTQEVVENKLGSIDLTNLFGNYRIKLTVRDYINTQYYYTSVNIGARNGFPISAGSYNFFSPPTAANLDENMDNGLEIISVHNTGYVYTWHNDGSQFWKKAIGTAGSYSHPAVADINLDGNLEIVILDCSYLDVLDKNGDQISPWPLTVPKDPSYPDCHVSNPVIANLDGDISNGLEIIFGADDGNIYAYHYDKTPVSGWPKQTGGRVISTPAVADLDPQNNNGLEVVVGSSQIINGKIYVWKADGTNYKNGIWPKSINYEFYSSPVIGDLDNDSSNGLEIVIADTFNDNKLFAWHADNGNSVTNWPISYYGDELELLSPVMGNIDNNLSNGLEVAIEGKFLADVRGASAGQISGWPQDLSPKPNGALYYKEQYDNAPALVDLDNDGKQEVIIANVGNVLPIRPKIYAFNDDGTLISGFPLILNDYLIDNTPLLYDIDNNGKLELIFTGKKLHVFDLPWTYNTDKLDASTFHYDDERIGFYNHCSDGTPYGQCNESDQYCDKGTLVACPAKILDLSFNENSGKVSFDTTVFQNNAFLDDGNCSPGSGECPSRVTGHQGKALSFDGNDDYVQIPYNPSLNIKDEIMIDTWVKLKSYDEHGGIVGKAGYTYYLNIHSWRLCLGLWDNNDHGICWPFTTTTLPLNQWHHIVAWWNGSLMRLIVDDEEKVRGNFNGTLRTPHEPVILGQWPDWRDWTTPPIPNLDLDGVIDQVKIYREIPACSDGTLYYQCNPSTHKYCDDGTLISCPSSKPYCSSTSLECEAKCSDGTPFGQCNHNNPPNQQYCNNGILTSCPSDIPYCSATTHLCEARCSDGTPFGQCNAQGKYCNNGALVDDCNHCGECHPPLICNPDNGQCVSVRCVINTDCDDGSYCTNDTCQNPGQANSYCSYSSIPNDCGTWQCGRSSSGCFMCGTCPDDKCCLQNSRTCSTCEYNTPPGQCSAVKPYFCARSYPDGFCNFYQYCSLCHCPDIVDEDGDPKYFCKKTHDFPSGECVLNPEYDEPSVEPLPPQL